MTKKIAKTARRRKKVTKWPVFKGRVLKAKKKIIKERVCSLEQAKIDQKLFKSYTKGLEALTRKQLGKVCKKNGVVMFRKTSAQLIKELRVIAKSL